MPLIGMLYVAGLTSLLKRMSHIGDSLAGRNIMATEIAKLRRRQSRISKRN